MKKIFLFLTALFFMAHAEAQVGIFASFGLSKYNYEYNGRTSNPDREFNYDLGLTYYMKAGSTLVFSPSIEYTPIVAQVNVAGAGNGDLYLRTRLNYLQFSLPVKLSFLLYGHREKGEEKSGFELGAGPFFSKLMSGSFITTDIYDKKTTQSAKIGSSRTDDFTGGNVGLEIHAGVRYNHISGYIVDNLGYHNISPVAGEKVHTRSLMIRLGYFF